MWLSACWHWHCLYDHMLGPCDRKPYVDWLMCQMVLSFLMKGFTMKAMNHLEFTTSPGASGKEKCPFQSLSTVELLGFHERFSPSAMQGQVWRVCFPGSVSEAVWSSRSYHSSHQISSTPYNSVDWHRLLGHWAYWKSLIKAAKRHAFLQLSTYLWER